MAYIVLILWKIDSLCLYIKYILLQVLSGSMFLCSANLKSLFAIELLLNKKSSYYPKNFTNDSVCAVCQKKILF